MEWTKTGNDAMYPNARYGHTTVLYQKKLYVFGGKTKNHNYYFLADLDVYNLENDSWTSPILYTKNTLELRKNHIAEQIGNFMILHGGVSENGEVLGDTNILSFSPLKWQTCSISDETPGPNLQGHACCLVLPHDLKYNPKMNIYKYPDIGIGRQGGNRVQIIF